MATFSLENLDELAAMAEAAAGNPIADRNRFDDLLTEAAIAFSEKPERHIDHHKRLDEIAALAKKLAKLLPNPPPVSKWLREDLIALEKWAEAEKIKHPKKRGRPLDRDRQVAAIHLLGKAWEAAVGSPPIVHHDWSDDYRYGPFLNFAQTALALLDPKWWERNEPGKTISSAQTEIRRALEGNEKPSR